MSFIYIRDPLFGNINFNKAEEEIIDTKVFQRLHYIKQLGLTFLVYPGATHTRFEHSLGVMQITRDITANAIEDENIELEIAGLLHDIGHGPFSHASDSALAKFLKTNHERIGEQKIKDSLSEILEKNSVSMDKMLKYYRGEGVGEIITGALGSDRIDYLMRDALHIGVAYGVIDYNRIKGKLRILDDKPVLYEEGIQGAESLLISRYFMHNSVYKHHTCIIAELMYEKALFGALENGVVDPSELLELRDDIALGRISEHPWSAKIIEQLMMRKLFKRVYYKDVEKPIKVNEIEEEIERNGVNSGDYVVKLNKLSGKGDDVQIIDKKMNRIGKLSDLSPLVKTLMELIEKKSTFVIAAKKDKVPLVHKAIQKVLID